MKFATHLMKNYDYLDIMYKFFARGCIISNDNEHNYN